MDDGNVNCVLRVSKRVSRVRHYRGLIEGAVYIVSSADRGAVYIVSRAHRGAVYSCHGLIEELSIVSRAHRGACYCFAGYRGAYYLLFCGLIEELSIIAPGSSRSIVLIDRRL